MLSFLLLSLRGDLSLRTKRVVWKQFPHIHAPPQRNTFLLLLLELACPGPHLCKIQTKRSFRWCPPSLPAPAFWRSCAFCLSVWNLPLIIPVATEMHAPESSPPCLASRLLFPSSVSQQCFTWPPPDEHVGGADLHPHRTLSPSSTRTTGTGPHPRRLARWDRVCEVSISCSPSQGPTMHSAVGPEPFSASLFPSVKQTHPLPTPPRAAMRISHT